LIPSYRHISGTVPDFAWHGELNPLPRASQAKEAAMRGHEWN
jgi:hypothetical protein